MSSEDRPEMKAMAELERILQLVSHELASWRRRALTAEAARSELGADHDAVASRQRINELEAENAELGSRLASVRGRLEDLLARLQFLEEQVEKERSGR
ncbi:MAG: hypothetical protein ACE5HT_06695 [Gemmatimonadales bacterium]